jgi:hypothetical protein
MAMASWVKPLAVPGPPPGPWEAKAADVAGAAMSVAVNARRDIRCIIPDNGMTISRENFQKIRTTAYAGFENVARKCVKRKQLKAD